MYDDFANDDGFVPITMPGRLEMMAEMAEARAEGGQEGVNAYLLNRYHERGDQLVDIPVMTWDDDYSVMDAGLDMAESAEEAFDNAAWIATLFRDLYTELFAGWGAIVASVVNSIVKPDIDDMARPPQEMLEVGSIFLPSLKSDAGFGHWVMDDALGILLALPPDTAVFDDRRNLLRHIDTGTVGIADRRILRRNTIFGWASGNPRFGEWQ